MYYIKRIVKIIFFYFKYNVVIPLSANINLNIKLENDITIQNNCVINCKSIGKYTFIGEYTKIDKFTKSIGRFCSISSNVKIGLGPHPLECTSTHPFFYNPKYKFVKNIEFDEFSYSGYTEIGNDVLISANVLILAGVKIGDGSVIGAGSIVTKDVEPYAIVAGNPAKHVRYRFDKETIKKLKKIKWWNWNEEKIMKNIEKFKGVI
jgi:virginiamycin A acetyltransferase